MAEAEGDATSNTLGVLDIDADQDCVELGLGKTVCSCDAEDVALRLADELRLGDCETLLACDADCEGVDAALVVAEPELVTVDAWLAEPVEDAVREGVRVTVGEGDSVELGVRDCDRLWLSDWLFVDACDSVGVPVADPVDTADALVVWDGDCVDDHVPDEDRVNARL